MAFSAAANACPAAVVPTLQDVVGLYSTVGGYQVGNEASDNGTDVQAMCDFLVSTGFLGHKAQASGPVDHANLDHVKWSIELYGGVRFGFDLPQSAKEQFNAGQNLTYVPGSPSLGELLSQGKANVQAPWLGLTGFFSIAVMLSLLIFIGEGVRDAFDPRKTFR